MMKVEHGLFRLIVRLHFSTQESFRMIRHTSTLATGLLNLVCLFSAASCLGGGVDQPSVHPRPDGEPSGDQLARKYGGRAPRPCPRVTSQPTDAQATALVQCGEEGPSAYGWEKLLTKVKVHVTNPANRFIANAFVDNRAPMYEIVGEAYQYICDPVSSATQGKNCSGQPVAGGGLYGAGVSKGICYRRVDGEYRCDLVLGGDPRYGNGLEPGQVRGIAPPTTY